MRVLHLISSLTRGGAEVQVAWLVKALRKQGVEAAVCCIREKGDMFGDLEAAGVPVYFHPFKSRLSPTSLWKLRTLLLSERFDLLHTHMYRPNTSGTVAALSAGHLPVVCSYHSRKLWDTKRQTTMDRRLHRFRNRLLFVSQEAMEIFLKETGLPPDRCRTFPNGIEPEPFLKAEGARFRKEWNLPANTPVISMIARFAKAKDHATFLRAAHITAQQFPEARFLLVGDGRTKVDVERMAGDLFPGPQSQLIFTGMRSDIPEILAASDILVLASHWEGFPISVLEAQVVGKPMVSNPVGAVPKVIEHGKTGFLFPQGQHTDLALILCTLIGNKALCTQVGTAGRKLVLERYTMEQVAGELRNIYAEVLDGL